jgi:lipopolysaccharide transport system ATP-binding protein
MSNSAIRVEGLSKRYRLGEREAYRTLRDALSETLRRAWDRHARSAQPLTSDGTPEHPQRDIWIWALKDLAFEIKQGEVVGVIGRNGTGKSTLLKILARITEPTAGYAAIQGRVGSLLEVGTGFSPELTGRENIYLSGAILGMKKAEIARKFDEIVAFAEIEKFLDTPVKRYSSGMYMRLAFAVAAHLESEILLVDEVLAVGDVAFQKKCLGKIGKVAKGGRTVLFVSHNMVAVQSLCTRVLCLQQGQLLAEGPAAQVVPSYLQLPSSLTEKVWVERATAPGNDKIRLRRVCVRPEAGVSSDPIDMRTPIVMEFEFWNLLPEAQLQLNFELITEQELVAFASNPTDESGWHGAPSPIGLFCSRCFIPGDLLKAGQYHVLLMVVKDGHHILYEQEDALVFEVQESIELRQGWYGEHVGVVRPLLRWTTELIESQPSAR